MQQQASISDKIKSWPLYVLPHHLVSRVVLKLTRIESRFVPGAVRIFVKLFNIDTTEAVQSDLSQYRKFNEFFTRELKPGVRPINNDPRAFCSPVDGRISQLGDIQGNSIVQAKNHNYTVSELLGARTRDCESFDNGKFATIYLSPRDYHRIHMPLTGKLESMHYIPGRLFSVAPHTVRVVPRLFARNERVVALFDTEIGKLAMVLVGAINVAAIDTVWAGEITPNKTKSIDYCDYDADAPTLNKGEEMGRFNMGSTVVMLLQNGRFAEELTADQPVRMGQLFGHFD